MFVGETWSITVYVGVIAYDLTNDFSFNFFLQPNKLSIMFYIAFKGKVKIIK